MPTNPHYEAVRKAVIAACPELMKLSNQCKVYAFGHEEGWVTLPYHDGPNTLCITWANGEFETLHLEGKKFPYEIIGYPIQLSHILRTFLKIHPQTSAVLDLQGDFVIMLPNYQDNGMWNIEKDDLADQEPSVWKALDKMLSV